MVRLIAILAVLAPVSFLTSSFFMSRSMNSLYDGGTEWMSPLNAAQQQCDSLPLSKPILNPFRDFEFDTPTPTFDGQLSTSAGNQQSAPPPIYSSYHCVSTSGRGSMQTEADSLMKARRPNYMNRSCYYKNLYYRVKDQTFHFLASPAEAKVWETKATQTLDLEEFQGRMQVSIGVVPDAASPDKAKILTHPWRPKLQTRLDTGHYATFKATTGLPLYFLIFHPFHSFNFGHLLWDDILSLFSLLDLFSLTNEAMFAHTVPFFVENFNKKTKKILVGTTISGDAHLGTP